MKPETNEEWESRFDKYWGLDMGEDDGFNEMRDFIKTEIRKAEERTKKEAEKALIEYADRMIEDKHFSRIWFKAHINLGLEALKK